MRRITLSMTKEGAFIKKQLFIQSFMWNSKKGTVEEVDKKIDYFQII